MFAKVTSMLKTHKGQALP